MSDRESMADLSAANATEALDDFAAALRVPKAIHLVDRKPGLYSIFIDDPKLITECFSSRLIQRKTNLLYVGSAKDSLYRRLIEQELRHKRPATFFRSIGAVLGFRPAPGSLAGKSNKANFRFSKSDTEQIIRWIDAHLLVRWLPIAFDELVSVEPMVIRELRPLFNARENPDTCKELADLRKLCRKIACR